MPAKSRIFEADTDGLIAGALAFVVIFLVARGVMSYNLGMALTAVPLAMIAVGMMISKAIIKAGK